jgi:hypothetical protein
MRSLIVDFHIWKGKYIRDANLSEQWLTVNDRSRSRYRGAARRCQWSGKIHEPCKAWSEGRRQSAFQRGYRGAVEGRPLSLPLAYQDWEVQEIVSGL